MAHTLCYHHASSTVEFKYYTRGCEADIYSRYKWDGWWWNIF